MLRSIAWRWTMWNSFGCNVMSLLDIAAHKITINILEYFIAINIAVIVCRN
jgi:hypothetical protein